MNEKIMAVKERHYPKESDITPAMTRIVVVLVRGGRGDDYAAYAGDGDPEWVMAFGNKLSFAEANFLFGDLEEDKYRR